MTEILKSEAEKNLCKECLLQEMSDILISFKFEAADKLLDYFSSTNEDRAMLKNKIDTLKVGRHFKRENSEDLEILS